MAVTSSHGDVRVNISSTLLRNKTRAVGMVNPSLDDNGAYSIHNNDRIIVHTCYRLHKFILPGSQLVTVNDETTYDKRTPPCQAWRSLRSPKLPSTTYPSSPLSAVMKTMATSFPVAVFAAVGKSESLKLDDITVLSDLERLVMASNGF